MIDTHSHLLPGIDHGCPDLATALLMARAAAASGVETVVCTPHLPEWDEITVRRAGEVIEELRQTVAAAGLGLALKLGFEVDLSIAATIEAERLRALVIEGSGGAIILEMPYTGWPLYIEETLFRLSTTGFIPVLAHPERNERIQKSSDPLAGCLRAGAVVQGTAGSLGGEFGRAAVKTFFRLVSEGSISLLASDAHAHRVDGWTMDPMLAALQGEMDRDELFALTDTNPARLLAGDKPQAVMPAYSGTPRRHRARRQKRG